ncbi:MAG: response regulator [Verrucomicrobia bacterium]|nr:response regulator [Verrucomicrobiota bacterium]
MNTEHLYLLIVEDEEAHVAAIRRAYEASVAAPEIHSVATLREFDASVQARPPDLVLMDLNLPDGLAVEVLTHPSADAPFPILVMTAFGNQQIVVEVMKAGALDYVVKSPEAFAAMPQTVERALREWKLLQQHKQAEAAQLQSLHEKEALLMEIHHRVNNNLQIISSLLRLQANKIDHPGATAALLDMQHRVRSMALIHEQLYDSQNFTAIDLAAFLRHLTNQLFRSLVLNPRTIQLHFELAPVHLKMDLAIPCALLVNELLTNAFKHAFPAGRSGELRVTLQPHADGHGWRLCVADNGVGLPPDLDLNDLTSLGLQLVTDLTRQLGGRLQLGAGPGAVFELEFASPCGPALAGNAEG